MHAKKLLIALFIIYVSTLAAATPDLVAPEWHMINVNESFQQGDAHLLFDNDETVLVDAGTYSEALRSLVPYLNQNGVRHVDHIFISHPHFDHYGGVDSLLESGITIGNIYHNELPPSIEDSFYIPSEFNATLNRARISGTEIHNIGEGFFLQLPTSTITVLVALKNTTTTVNDYSLIMQWDAGGYRSLFTGDLDFPLGTVLSQSDSFGADILKMPHHGIIGIAPDAFFDMVGPSIAMIPAPENLWTDLRGEQVRLWVERNINPDSVEQSLSYSCHNGLNGGVILRLHKPTIDILPEGASDLCPQQTINIEPKFEIDSPFDFIEEDAINIGALISPILNMLMSDD